jgi:predicted aspartyl protease
MKQGEVQQTNFKTKIPFETRLGVIILKVKINGLEYDFLFDTGAPNVISKELAQELEFKPKAKSKTKDSQGKYVKVEYGSIDTIFVGGIPFTNTGVGVIDVNASNTIACLELDGILGANLMRKAIWQIDYENQVITLSDNMESLTISEKSISVPFTTKTTGTPMLEMKLDSSIIQKRVTLDTGSNGHISLSSSTYNAAKKKELILSHSIGYGNLSSGIFGNAAIDTLDFYKIPTISFGDVQIDSVIVSSSRKRSSILGNEFFRNYVVTLNWTTKQMTLDSISQYTRPILAEYGIKPKFKDNKLLVGFIYAGSEAHIQGLQLGDQILELNGNDYTQMNQQKWCDFIYQYNSSDYTSLNLTILREGEKHVVELKKSTFLR